MKILRHENLQSTNRFLYDSTIKLREQYLWPKDGSTASEYEEEDKKMIYYLAVETVTNFLCGMVGYDPTSNRLRQLIIHPSFQGKGIGSKLVDHVKREALLLENKNLKVCAWQESVPFYLKKGFKVVDSPYLSKGVLCQKMEINMINI